MQITDLIDLATLRELNCSLSHALGLEMALVGGDDIPLTASPDWGNGRNDATPEVTVIPVYVNGREAARWQLRPSSRANGNGSGASPSYQDASPVHPGRSVIGVLERPATVDRDSIALVSLMARMMTDYAAANLGLLERVREHAAAALEATSAAIRAERLVDRSPNGLVEVDREGIVLWANKGARDTLDMDEFDSLGIAGPSAPWTVESIDDEPYGRAWMRLARELVKGRTVSNVMCVLSRTGDRRLVVRLDISPRLSDSGRLVSAMCALGEPAPPRSGDGASTSRVWDETLQPLMHAWLELDGARQALEQGDPDIEGRLDILACLLKEAVGSLNQSRPQPNQL